MACTCLGGFLLRGRFKCGKMGWPLHRQKNFYINDPVGLSMCECPTETVKYILVNIWCMFDWISSSQNCRYTLPLHTAVEQLRVQKLKTLLCPTNCLQPTPTSLLTKWKNTKIQIWLWFCFVWTVFNTRTTWHFHYYMYCLRKATR